MADDKTRKNAHLECAIEAWMLGNGSLDEVLTAIDVAFPTMQHGTLSASAARYALFHAKRLATAGPFPLADPALDDVPMAELLASRPAARTGNNK